MGVSDITLPIEWAKKLRAVQVVAITQALNHIKAGKRAVLIDAPTGVGKTIIGNEIHARLAPRVHTDPTYFDPILYERASGDFVVWDGLVYTCTTKQLQHQVVDDFTYGAVLKGRNNYPTQKFPYRYKSSPEYNGDVGRPGAWDDELSCEDCEYVSGANSCRYCESRDVCPYLLARGEANVNPLMITNTAYLLRWMRRRPNRLWTSKMVVMDEADELERQLQSTAEIYLPAGTMMAAEIEIPPIVTNRAKSAKKVWTWWADNTATKLGRMLKTMPTNNPKERRRARAVEELMESFRGMEFTGDDEGRVFNWVLDRAETKRGTSLIWKTPYPALISDKYLWEPLGWTEEREAAGKRGVPALLMSASMISPDYMASELGLQQGEYGTVVCPSPFPVENRPLVVLPIASMINSASEGDIEKVCRATARLVLKHGGERVLIHTVSYRLARIVSEYLRRVVGRERPVVAYKSAHESWNALKTYLSEHEAVMVAPSMERGVDLKDDACRVQIIVKMPYPYLGDPMINIRAHGKGGNEWYQIQTIRRLVQMTGRAIRHETDHAVTYVLDKKFLDVNKAMMPAWWRDAIDYSGELMPYVLR